MARKTRKAIAHKIVRCQKRKQQNKHMMIFTYLVEKKVFFAFLDEVRRAILFAVESESSFVQLKTIRRRKIGKFVETLDGRRIVYLMFAFIKEKKISRHLVCKNIWRIEEWKANVGLVKDVC